MKILRAEQLSEEEIALKLTEGFRLHSYEYCLSFIVVTLKRPSAVYLVAPGEGDWGNRTLFSSISFFFGWWGIPWGPIYTVGTICRNLSGGHDHSKALVDHVLAKTPSGPPALPLVYPPSASEKTPGIAVASLILGILAAVLFGPLASIPAIICGHLALSQIKKAQARKGRKSALVGLALGYLVTLFYLVFFIYLVGSALQSR